MAATESMIEGRVDDGRVVWLRGKHDISTVAAVWEMLDRFIALDDSDLVVDLSEVQIIDASTISIIIQARDTLQARSRALRLQSPSSSARRCLELYGLVELIDDGPIDTTPATTTALGSWVAVPTTDPVGQTTSTRNASLPAGERTPAG